MNEMTDEFYHNHCKHLGWIRGVKVVRAGDDYYEVGRLNTVTQKYAIHKVPETELLEIKSYEW